MGDVWSSAVADPLEVLFWDHLSGEAKVLKKDALWAIGASSTAGAESAQGRGEGFVAPWAFRTFLSFPFLALFPADGKPFPDFVGGTPF